MAEGNQPARAHDQEQAGSQQRQYPELGDDGNEVGRGVERGRQQRYCQYGLRNDTKRFPAYPAPVGRCLHHGRWCPTEQPVGPDGEDDGHHEEDENQCQFREKQQPEGLHQPDQYRCQKRPGD